MTLQTVVLCEIAIATGITIWQCRKHLSEDFALILSEVSLRLFVVGLLIVLLGAVAKALGN